MNELKLLREKEAAELMGISAPTLRKWRINETKGVVPYVKIGKSVRYRLSDIHEYVEKQLVAY